MSHLAIAEVSAFLRDTLWLGFDDDQDMRQIVQHPNNIVLSNPAQPTGPGAQRRLSLWLYQVMPNEHLRNADPVVHRTGRDETAFQPPLPLNLLYLLTPSAQATSSDDGSLNDQRILGRAMQVFHDQSILSMRGPEPTYRARELRISLAPRTIEELAKVWEAMQQPYRLSVCYEVRVVDIESRRPLAAGKVLEREAGFAPAGA